jgi:cell division septation protein DedD
VSNGQADGRTGGQWALGLCRPNAVRVGLTLALLSACPPARLSAQTEPRLAQGVRLAQEGLGDSARGVVERVVQATDPSDTLYPQALYARAAVAANAQDMRRDLQRIAVEYSSSSWADDALVRLAQLDFASAELEGAARELERLRLDYPSSPLFPQASFWAARVYFDLRKPASACRWLAEGLPRVGNDVELRNQLVYYDQRCAGVALDTAGGQADRRAGGPADGRTGGQAGAADSTNVATAAAAPTDTTLRSEAESLSARPPVRLPASRRSAFTIQIAAVNTRAAADSIAKRVTKAGFDPAVATEKGLFKIRVGRYATRAEAQTALPRVRARLGGTPFIVAPS